MAPFFRLALRRQARPLPASLSAIGVREKSQRVICMQCISEPEGPPSQPGVLPFRCRSLPETLAREVRRRTSRLGVGVRGHGVRGETLTTVSGGHFLFLRPGGIDVVSLLRQAHGLAGQRAQQDRRGRAPSVGPHHVFKPVVRASLRTLADTSRGPSFSKC